MSWNDFNAAEEQQEFDIIPAGTITKVRMTIKPGGYDDPARGWTDGYTTFNPQTGTAYLSCEFVVVGGKYDKRKLWDIIGLHSPKGPEWENKGRSTVKGILNSARNIDPIDNTPQAQQARCIPQGFRELDGIEFVAKIGKKKDDYGVKNSLQLAITREHKDHANVMAGFEAEPSVPTTTQRQQAYQPPYSQQSPPMNSHPQQSVAPQPQGAAPQSQPGRPDWAQ